MSNRLDQFPQPNEHFPIPPRPADGWSWRGVVVFSLMFWGSLAAIFIVARDDVTVPYGLAPAVVIAAVLGIVISALGAPLATYNAWRLHTWRYGTIVPARVVRERRHGDLFAVLEFLVIKFIPIFGYFIWLKFGGQSAKVRYIERGATREIGVICDDDGPPEGATVWLILSRFPFPPRLLEYAWAPAEFEMHSPQEDVVEWLDNALATSQGDYTYKGGKYDKRA
jgi:hypothetical protein